MEWSGVEIVTVTTFCESVNGMLLCMKNRVCKCNSEGVAWRMSRNERIRVVPSAKSRIPTSPHCEFNGDWSCRCTALQSIAILWIDCTYWQDWSGNRNALMLLITVIASNPCILACIPSSIGGPSLCNLWECNSSSSVWITTVKQTHQWLRVRVRVRVRG